MNRGSGTYKPGDPVYMIETIRGDPARGGQSWFKVFTSESGFKAGIRAVEWDVNFATQHGSISSYKTYVLRNPRWEALP